LKQLFLQFIPVVEMFIFQVMVVVFATL